MEPPVTVPTQRKEEVPVCKLCSQVCDKRVLEAVEIHTQGVITKENFQCPSCLGIEKEIHQFANASVGENCEAKPGISRRVKLSFIFPVVLSIIVVTGVTLIIVLCICFT